MTEYEKIIEARKLFRELCDANTRTAYDQLVNLRNAKERELLAVAGTSIEAEIERGGLRVELSKLRKACYEAALRL